MIRIGTLFSGIGGLELGIEIALAEASLEPRILWQVERVPFRRLVLAKHWPDANRSIVDVKKAGATNLSPVDLLCGGFPCQDVSSAGKGEGLSGARSGLWYEFRRITEELRPPLVIVENVASGASRWLPFVKADLEALNYEVTPLHISAADVGAPQRRARIFVVAYRHDFRIQAWTEGLSREECAGWSLAGGGREHVADTCGQRERGPDAEADPRRAPREASAGGDASAVAHRGGGVADSASARLEGAGLRRSAPERGGLGGDLAHTDEGGLSSFGRCGQLDPGERAPRGHDAYRCGGAPGQVHDGGPDAQPEVDRSLDGIPDRVVRGLHGTSLPVRWPAGRGQPQHPWEPPRAVWRDSVNDHEEALAALGDAVVPACSREAMRRALEIGGFRGAR